MNKEEQICTEKNESNKEKQTFIEKKELVQETAAQENMPVTNSQEPAEGIKNPEDETPSRESDHEGGITEDKPKTEKKTIKKMTKKTVKVILLWIQVATAIGALFSAYMAWNTLIEMKAERDIAYRPEVVVMPSSFEGKLVGIDELEENKKYIGIKNTKSNPEDCYVGGPLNDNGYIYLETPYLTLKNIGRGTAKDITVTFSSLWVKRMAWENLRFSQYDYKVKSAGKIETGPDYVALYYSAKGESEWTMITSNYASKTQKRITYIASGDDSVNVTLPEAFYHVFAVYINQFPKIYARDPSSHYITRELQMPNLYILIEYSDMQGNHYKQKEYIPWTGGYQTLRSTTSKGEEMELGYIWTAFYNNYER